MQKYPYIIPTTELILLSPEMSICQMSGQIEELDPVAGPFGSPSLDVLEEVGYEKVYVI